MRFHKPQPRFIRQKDAPHFFAVSRGKFDANIRPYLKEIWWGENPQAGIVYDLLEMHALADKIKERNGRPAERRKIWDVNIENQDCISSKGQNQNSGMFKAHSSAKELDKALKLSREKRLR